MTRGGGKIDSGLDRPDMFGERPSVIGDPVRSRSGRRRCTLTGVVIGPCDVLRSHRLGCRLNGGATRGD